jgi:hypothetical protein
VIFSERRIYERLGLIVPPILPTNLAGIFNTGFLVDLDNTRVDQVYDERAR